MLAPCGPAETKRGGTHSRLRALPKRRRAQRCDVRRKADASFLFFRLLVEDKRERHKTAAAAQRCVLVPNGVVPTILVKVPHRSVPATQRQKREQRHGVDVSRRTSRKLPSPPLSGVDATPFASAGSGGREEV
ncbi:hypothetical protein HPB50_018869 [Hyalomma asiaticum]|uniref:Uncharacterized protein n=1 Tax=Hyalomma asiaticum TaxID=266040 RepID=A0ACB7S516_HYAAI|nr:hypothetical protein HPB50_018869 [Hyalomma asiaticum]